MARRTVLVCDSCGKEVGENKGAGVARHVHGCPPRLEGRGPVRHLCRQDAGSRRRPPGTPAEVCCGCLRAARWAGAVARAPSPARPPVLVSKERGSSVRPGNVLAQVYDGSMGLSLLAGPANAGKVALLLERYLARLDDEPFLIVPNRSDVDRVERDLLRRCGCLLGGSIGTFDDLFERLAAADPDRRPVASDAQRALIARRAVATVLREGTTPMSASARFGGFVGRPPRGGRRARVRACSTRPTWTASLRRSTRPTAPSWTASSSGIATSCGEGPASGSQAISTPGTASPCSPTGSRI